MTYEVYLIPFEGCCASGWDFLDIIWACSLEDAQLEAVTRFACPSTSLYITPCRKEEHDPSSRSATDNSISTPQSQR